MSRLEAAFEGAAGLSNHHLW